jgi:uncharacterized protein involved in exopolysaccharide biosynthesis
MDSKNRLEHILHCLVEYRKLWLLPAIVGLVLATGYAFFIKSETWTARQTMIIRDDLLGQTFKPGQFLSEEALKSAQETVLETARRPEVIRATLEKIGPSRKSLLGLGGVPSNWPTHSTIEDFRGSITFESANGGEFGKSDLIVLAAKTSNPERSAKFLTVLMEEMDSRLSEVRASQFESMESELQATCESALTTRSDLEDRIKEMDASFGTNISTVQSMNERAAGSPSAFDNKLNQIRSDRRLAVSEMASLKLIKESLKNSESSLELPTSRELLASQPALAELVTGLAKAKSELSEAEGKYNADHPRVQQANSKIASMQRQINDAIPATINGLDGQIAVLEDRIEILDATMEENADLLKKISSKRVPYAALARDLEKQTENYSDASARLAQVKSRKDASKSIQLLTRIGEPWVGTRSDGLGKRMLSLVGGIAGLIVGLGLVMIVAPPFIDPTLVKEAAETSVADDQPRQGSKLADRVSHDQYKPAESPVDPAPTATPAPLLQTPAPVVAAVAPVAAAAVVATQAKPTGPVAPAPSPPAASETQLVQIPAPEVAAPLAVAPEVTMPEETMPEAISVPPQVTVRQAAPVDAAQVPDSPSTEADEEVTPKQSAPVLREPQDSSLAPPPLPRPASKTLAAIFANMPQPKTDVSLPLLSEPEVEPAEPSVDEINSKIDELAEELATGSNTEVPARTQTETIQLDDSQTMLNESLTLQRRTSVVRPVDLARVDEKVDVEIVTSENTDQDNEELSRETIDSAFSQLEPAQPNAPTSEIASEDDQDIFREDN